MSEENRTLYSSVAAALKVRFLPLLSPSATSGISPRARNLGLIKKPFYLAVFKD
jgi:hypothetical protein